MEDSLSRKLAALADPTRRAIIARLARGDATVSELQQPFDISQPAISRHLKVLEAAGLIEQGRAAQARPRRLKVDALREPSIWFDEVAVLWRDSFDRLDALLAEDKEG
ncbi:ArsR family transcriptional regulator [Sphingomonas sp. Root710]|uniref:ArsR/SmtB family transcription factor n=1 Tax=Sphingomonas sp. Root710 TaxID=1736594 RepID=UPI0006FF5118|nr:metalloregulator ArsR/SmtB family transcription factor [Sphingomonas sp. Root710]KRB86468.1 ArsR family transcriptional regulator [Sphingomonas sp. Root710]